MAPIPITIITGFLGSGKTTILLNLIPQLPPTYRLALLKNEFGDVAVDSQLAAANSISGVRELLNGCICCNLVGQLGDALIQLREEVKPDRIVIETSGSAFPATLAMEVNRVSRERKGEFMLDGVVAVIDVENWEGYDDTSYTAKLQAKYTDLIVFNKWELVSERRFDICLDRVGDLDVQTAWVKSEKGKVDKDVLLGIDGALLAKEMSDTDAGAGPEQNSSLDMLLVNKVEGKDVHKHSHDHQSEVEVLSISLTADSQPSASSDELVVDTAAFKAFLESAPKDEIYRIKGIIRFSSQNTPSDSSGDTSPPKSESAVQTCILNWAFGRWTLTPSPSQATVTKAATSPSSSSKISIARLTLILARYESAKWKKKLEGGQLVKTMDAAAATSFLQVDIIG
ncbi:CobW domain-containing protein [Arthroderma uncinatum]|uniref:CobW domain-containing protein n=1 Tax=Arthroderma uncinatum TaxID=74035 RepID=UPI00144A8F29|nr:CobW domain-containing protein [Arthroderma uncinatum]KAF3480855.1 CobW domain-containing protein [Arthroderma uncinatum]